MAEVVESDVFQAGVLQDLLVKVDYGIRVVHFASDRGGEHIGISWVLFVLLNQQVYCHLRDGDEYSSPREPGIRKNGNRNSGRA